MTSGTCISNVALYLRLKSKLGEVTGRSPKDIFAHQELRAAPLGFSNQGVRALATPLELEFAEFSITVSSDETGNATTVRDLFRLLQKKIKTACEGEVK